MILARLRQRYPLVSQTLDEFARDRCGLLAASLAFHALLAVAPLAIVAVAIAGIFLGRGAAHAELIRVLEENFGPKGASAIEEWVNEASSGGEAASAVGLVLMVLAASKLGTRLREVLNLLWDIDADALVPSARVYVRRRLLAIGLVALTGPTLLLIFASRALLTAFHAMLFDTAPRVGVLVQVLQVVLSLALVTAAAAVVFRHVPDTHVTWRVAWIGGALTSLLFNAGNALVGLYLGRTSIAAAYGAAGSVIVVLLWFYFSAHMFLLGAEFTTVYAAGRRSTLAG